MSFAFPSLQDGARPRRVRSAPAGRRRARNANVADEAAAPQEQDQQQMLQGLYARYAAQQQEDGGGGGGGGRIDLTPFLPAVLRGVDPAEDRRAGRPPLELDAWEGATEPTELWDLLRSSDNAVVYFYKPTCPYCVEFTPVYALLANQVHRTNRRSPMGDAIGADPVPIVMAQIDGSRHRGAIDARAPGLVTAFPTVIFRRGADGALAKWDPANERTVENLSAFMADFFGDPTLRPLDSSVLLRRMRNPDREFDYIGSTNVDLVPRFVRPLDPAFVSLPDAVATLNLVFLLDPELARNGTFFPANLADRPDLPVPAIVTRGAANQQPTTYAFRDAARWQAMRLADQLGVDASVANAR
jgi:thiol-disulfide isomerase/thioredoxin